MCYYSLGYLDFVCGDASSADFKNTEKGFQEIRKKHIEYKKLKHGKICWAGDDIGKEYDPMSRTQIDFATAHWYRDNVPPEEIKKLEKRLSKYCKENDCKLSVEKGAFICGGGKPSVQSTSLLIFILLAVHIFTSLL